MERPQGVFVTLRKKGDLRGCIGQMTPDRPLRVFTFDPSAASQLETVGINQVTLPVVFKDLGTVEGTLRTAAGQPVRGTVAIAVPGGFTRTASADAATGHYRLTDVPFGSFSLGMDPLSAVFVLPLGLVGALGAVVCGGADTPEVTL